MIMKNDICIKKEDIISTSNSEMVEGDTSSNSSFIDAKNEDVENFNSALFGNKTTKNQFDCCSINDETDELLSIIGKSFSCAKGDCKSLKIDADEVVVDIHDVSVKKQADVVEGNVDDFDSSCAEDENGYDDTKQIDKDAIPQHIHIQHSIHTQSPVSDKFNQAAVSRVKLELIDRIIVSRAALDNNQIVKVAFSEALLPSTEVVFQKVGQVTNIAFVTSNSSVAAFLNNSTEMLAQHLSNTLNMKDVRIVVSSETGDINSGAPNDGRSRNKYYADDEHNPEQDDL